MAPTEEEDPNVLPPKEAAVFRQVVKHYETKQYKKGLKQADAILKNHPLHGETLAMKGLLLNSLGNKADAMDFVKRGVKANIKSYVCWHVYGLIQQSEENFAEAMKCYKNALRHDAENATVQRDLALLQIQLRDLPGLLETRQAMLEARSTNRQNWLAFAVAHHLNGHYDVAAAVLDAFEKTVDEETAKQEPYETSEVLLYKAQILEEGRRYEAALKAVDAAHQRGLVRDRLGRLTARARLLEKLGRTADASDAYWELLEANPEDHVAYAGLQRCVDIEDDDNVEESSKNLYAQILERFPRSNAARRLALDVLEGLEFQNAAEAYARRGLECGIPSLFRDLRPLLASPNDNKAEMLLALFQRLEAEYIRQGDTTNQSSDDYESTTEAPASVWAKLFLAQAAELSGQLEDALVLIDACLEVRPRLIDALSVRASLLAALGDVQGAADVAESARKLDLADRFVNGVAVRALFRAGRCEEAVATASLFTREGEHTNNLYDMQATWYETAAGEAYLGRRDYGRALKNFLKVTAHYKEFVGDQYDFHNYCLRKQTLRTYIDLLRFEDQLYSHPAYAEGAYGAVETYLALDDQAREKKKQLQADAKNGSAAADAKKARQKARKEEQRREREEAAAKHNPKNSKPKDADPDGVQLAATQTPLEEADTLVKRLVACAGDRLRTQELAFEVELRRGRLLQVLRAAQNAERLGGKENPTVHRMVVRLSRADRGTITSTPVEQVLAEQLKALRGGVDDLQQYTADWAKAHARASVSHAAAALEVASAGKSAPEVAQLAHEFVDNIKGSSTASHEECAAALKLLRDRLAQDEAAEAWRIACATRYPRSNLFACSLQEGLANLQI